MKVAKSTTRVAPKQIRCATYTRVSTDQGLDQEFNSLDAQREASEAYIKSQAHEGWTCLKQGYDDGGYSGGSLDRPALQRLLDDVRARKLDVIVVYKVDRLTRSLADFAKLVELFDAHNVSFVSVTQSFNTTSSMGRLTLNVLLSFAQFEREVTGERIRDKVAASKKKGMWMGGPVPLGYCLENKKLVVEPKEAEKIRRIFSLYLELQSLPKLVTRLKELGILSRQRTYHGDRTIGGQPFRTGALSLLLANRIYIGEVRHHTQHYTGEHPPILDKALFDAVQAELASRLNRKKGQTHASPSILKGLLYDSNGNLMVPVHANKAGVRYHYYQSWVLNHGQNDKAGLVNRVPAQEIEEAVQGAVKERFSVVEERGTEIGGPMELRDVIDRIDVLANHLRITLKADPSETATDEVVPRSESGVITVPWSKPPMRRRRSLMGTGNGDPFQRPMRAEARSRMLQGIAQGRLWLDLLISKLDHSIGSIAKEQKLSERTVRSTLSLALLAPDIVDAVIDGRLARGLKLTQMTDLSADWQEQRKALDLV